MVKGPLDPKDVGVIARIAVLEFLVANLFNMLYGQMGITVEQGREEHRIVRALMKRQTNPGYDAAQSDLITGEMEIALDSVLEQIEQLHEHYSKFGKPKSN